MKNYEQIKNTVIETLAETAKIKQATINQRQITAFNAVSILSEVPTVKEYEDLFNRLKADCKEKGYKFAGSPLHKAFNVVKTVKFDFSPIYDFIVEKAEKRTEETAEERLFFAFAETLKENKLTFSSTVAQVSAVFSGESPEKADKELDKILDFIGTCDNASLQAIVDAVLARGESQQALKKSA